MTGVQDVVADPVGGFGEGARFELFEFGGRGTMEFRRVERVR